MAIQLPQGFNIRSAESIDARIALSKAEMKAMNENIMPAHYFAICTDDNKFYVFDKNNTIDETLGKFRLYQAPVDSTDLADKLPNAVADVMQSEGGAEEMLNAMFNTEHFQATVDKKIDLAISLIQAVESN